MISFLPDKTSLANSFARIICVHIEVVTRNNRALHSDLAALLNAALATDMWRCRHDGPVPTPAARVVHHTYDMEFMAALGEAHNLIEVNTRALVAALVDFDTQAAYDVHTRGIFFSSEAARLMYLLRGAYEEFTYGHAF